MNRTKRLTKEARPTKGAKFISIIFVAGAIALLVASRTTSSLDREAMVSTHTNDRAIESRCRGLRFDTGVAFGWCCGRSCKAGRSSYRRLLKVCEGVGPLC